VFIFGHRNYDEEGNSPPKPSEVRVRVVDSWPVKATTEPVQGNECFADDTRHVQTSRHCVACFDARADLTK